MSKKVFSKVIEDLEAENIRSIFVAHVFRELMSKVKLLVQGEETKKYEPGSEADLKSLMGHVGLIKVVAKMPNHSMGDLHDAWLEKQVKEGWVYGEVYNEEKKESPRILPYDQTAGVVKYMDKIFELSVRALLYRGESNDR
jgi:hypothetical protein